MYRRTLIRFLWFCAVALALPAAADAGPLPALGALYRDDVAHAIAALKWRDTLSDETLLAAAASGLTWQPEWHGAALFKREKKGVAYTDAGSRLAAFSAARRAGNDRLAAPFALSIALDPGDLSPADWKGALDYLSGFGDDFDSVLIGIEQAPPKLPLLPEYEYSAADLLVWRASPRLLPVLLTMAQSSDRYLRSRGVAGLGVAAYDPSQGKGDVPGLLVPVRAGSISANQRAMVADALRDAAGDKNYHVRAAAALALGLAGSEYDIPILEKLAKDPAYLASPAGDRNSRRITYPVRVEAVRALARFGKSAPEPPGGVLSGKELKAATRGGHDVTHDRNDIRKDRASRVRFCDGEW